MKKITAYVENGETVLELQDPLILTHGWKLYVKTEAVFWNYQNIRKGYNDYIFIDGKKTVFDEGYWTFKQLRKVMEEKGLTVEEYHDGKIKIAFTNGIKSLKLWNLKDIFGYESPIAAPRPSDRPVEIHEGLRYLTVGCNLVNRVNNIEPSGDRSDIIVSLPVDGTKPLFGTTTKYNDIERFSNVLTIAKNGMTFGKNEKVNYDEKVVHPLPTPTINHGKAENPLPAANPGKVERPEKPGPPENNDLGVITAVSFGLAYFAFR
ncbi:Hypothetical predicted protein [Paramuricea clavata]|uniref:Uncharacterized protein n=1 Tax=Paramuricea clavata TaxID=317549 RepID=A0A6S7HKH7_PARCT|nr:Hypothetical predicted protein [Paramuricea clavata]